MGASARDAGSSPSAIGCPPSSVIASALPPAASIRSVTQAHARSRAAASAVPVDTDGMRSQSSSSSRIVGMLGHSAGPGAAA